MEPSKKCYFVPKMIYFTKQVKNLKWEPARFLITLEHKGAENMGNHMEPSKKSSFVAKMICFTKRAQNLKKWEPARFQITC